MMTVYKEFHFCSIKNCLVTAHQHQSKFLDYLLAVGLPETIFPNFGKLLFKDDIAKCLVLPQSRLGERPI